MSKRNWFLIVVCIFPIAFLLTVSFADGLGTSAPSFQVRSGDGRVLTLDMIKGKVIVIFYETKDVVEKNRRLKYELNKFYDEQPDTIKELIVKLPIITKIWKSKLRENSKREGITIYGDWSGKMFSDYKMKDEESNVVIIDKKGIIRYIASGKVGDKEINKIKELLRKLGNEK